MFFGVMGSFSSGDLAMIEKMKLSVAFNLLKQNSFLSKQLNF